MKFFLLFSIFLIGTTNEQKPPNNEFLCILFPCPPGSKCKVVDFLPRCVGVPPILPPTSTTKPPTKPTLPPTSPTRTPTRPTRSTRPPFLTCASVDCIPRFTCVMVYPIFCPPGCQPHPQCVRHNPCRFKRCRFFEECVLVQVFCPRSPCDPVAECRPRIWPWPIGK